MVQWLRDGLQIISDAAEIEPLASTVRDNGGVFFVPAFAGLGAPYWDQYARGAIVGLTRGVTRGHIARAAIEAIALQTLDIMDCMKKDSGLPLSTLRVDGGASRNNMLMQCQANVLGVPVERPHDHRDHGSRRSLSRRACPSASGTARKRCPPCGSWIAASSPPWTRSAAPSCSTTGIAP